MVQPKEKFRTRNIQLSVFPNEKSESLVIQKSYKKEEKWINKNLTIFPEEIDSLKQVIQAYEESQASPDKEIAAAIAVAKRKEDLKLSILCDSEKNLNESAGDQTLGMI